MDVTIRSARDGDAEELISLIGDCFAEYPGCVLDVEGEMPHLLAIATAYRKLGGCFWVAESERVVGSVGVVASREGGGVELRSLYVARPARRQGLGARLCELVEAEGRRRGALFVELWSDTRFLDAHRLYRRLGFTGGVRTRELHDLSATVEYYFRKELA
jgi:putative acetyltransferase